MNAWLGIYVRRSERDAAFPIHTTGLRSLGNGIFEEQRPQNFAAPGLRDVRFNFGPVKEHLRKYLPQTERDLEYGGISGPVFNSYDHWVWMADVYDDDDAEDVVADAIMQLSRFETEMAAVLNQLDFWALMLIPDSERLETFGAMDANAALKLLRRSVANWATCEGFLVTSLPRG